MPVANYPGALWFLGYADQALKMNHRAIEVARALSDPFSLTFAEVFLCYRAAIIGETCALFTGHPSA